jgi:hypothetical protein
MEYWIAKHNAYSSREAEDYFGRRLGQQGKSIQGKWLGDFAARKRILKRIYDRLPLMYRARWYYWYRMWLRFGFLDGPEGRIYHYLQGYWYRYLVDIKIRERQMAGRLNESNAYSMARNEEESMR